jgi:1,4-dihydroxy-2-naphthoyl-CoA hydrolase
MPFDPRELRSRFDELIGTQWLDDDPDHARARIELRDDLRQPAGILHGGVMLTLLESLCSRATAVAVLPDGNMAMGQSINVSFLRPVSEDGAEAKATARHRGRSTWVWEAEVVDDVGRVCALAQLTTAVRPLPPSESS